MNTVLLSKILLAILFSPVQPCRESLEAICKCELWFRGPYLRCESVVDLTSLVKRLINEKSHIHRLEIRGLQQKDIGPNAFENLFVRQIDLSDNVFLEKISPSAFSGQSQVLEDITISNTGLKAIPKLDLLPVLISADYSNNTLLSEIPVGVFANMPQLKNLRVRKCAVCSLEQFVLKELLSLELLDLSDNCLNKIPVSVLRNHQMLMYLDLSRNNLYDLATMQFAHLPNLKEVRLAGNQIRNLQPTLFVDVPNLEILNLAENRILNIGGGKLSHFEKLQMLNLTGNSLTRIQETSFTDLHSLQQLLLDNNKIRVIEPRSFIKCSKLELLSLQGNELTDIYPASFEGCVSLVVLQMSNNNLTKISNGMFNQIGSLEQLHLHSNQIVHIENNSLDSFTNLTTIDVANNQLDHLPSLKNISKLFWLDLSSNHFRKLSEDIFPPRVSTILLQDNPIDCGQTVDWLAKYLIIHNVRTRLPEQLNDAVCHDPIKFRGIRLQDIFIQRASDNFNRTIAALSPNGKSLLDGPDNPLNELATKLNGGKQLDLGVLTQLLPNLGSIINSPPSSGIFGGNALASLGRAFKDSGLPGAALLPEISRNSPAKKNPFGLYPEQSLIKQSPDAPAEAISDFIRPIQRAVSGYKPTPSDVSDFVNSIPQLLESSPAKFTAAQMSPDLLRHLLAGGGIPGVDQQTLDEVIKNYLKQMAHAAKLALKGIQDPDLEKILKPVQKLPVELIQMMVKGNALPGLNTAEMTELREYYMRQLGYIAPSTTPRTWTDTQVPLPRGFLPPMSAEELISRMPPDFDLSRLPLELIDQLASGKPFDISKLPLDMLNAFRIVNPDMETVIHETLTRDPIQPTKATTTTTQALTTTSLRWVPSTELTYDISRVDRNSDLKLSNPNYDWMIAKWTAIGLAVVVTISVLIFLGMLYAKRVSNANKQKEKARLSTPYFLNITPIPRVSSSCSGRTSRHLASQQENSEKSTVLSPPSPCPHKSSGQVVLLTHYNRTHGTTRRNLSIANYEESDDPSGDELQMLRLERQRQLK